MSVTHTTFAIQKDFEKQGSYYVALFNKNGYKLIRSELETSTSVFENPAFLSVNLLLFFTTFDEIPCRHRTSSAVCSHHYSNHRSS